MSVLPAIIASGLPGKRVDAQRAGITITAFMDVTDSNRHTADRGPRTAISAGDRVLIRRLSIAIAALFVFTAAFTRLDLLYSHKFFDVTGHAQWIWAQTRISSGVPVAFFASRDFEL